ncbi:hypothetical protein NADE_009068 [Nannochloris sp. 'desiccata']|nr:hypothetical protein KSW81_004162 [Chlorella desiccata (nom. nud.)]KAH7624256.1 hypothetical protein NADE_009068 [Chlorella desiccata (nom. nud.)]
MPLGLISFTRAVTKRARRGLYAGKKVLSGNNVSDDGGNRKVQLRVTTAALRNIDKAGSLDNYVMNTADKYLESDVAMDLKIEMLEKMLRGHGVAARAMQGMNLGLPAAAQAALEQPEPEPSSS